MRLRLGARCRCWRSTSRWCCWRGGRAFWLRFNLDIPHRVRAAWRCWPARGACSAYARRPDRCARVDRQVWSYIGLPELRQLAPASLLGGVLTAAAVLMLRLPAVPALGAAAAAAAGAAAAGRGARRLAHAGRAPARRTAAARRAGDRRLAAGRGRTRCARSRARSSGSRSASSSPLAARSAAARCRTCGCWAAIATWPRSAPTPQARGRAGRQPAGLGRAARRPCCWRRRGRASRC